MLTYCMAAFSHEKDKACRIISSEVTAPDSYLSIPSFSEFPIRKSFPVRFPEHNLFCALPKYPFGLFRQTEYKPDAIVVTGHSTMHFRESGRNGRVLYLEISFECRQNILPLPVSCRLSDCSHVDVSCRGTEVHTDFDCFFQKFRLICRYCYCRRIVLHSFMSFIIMPVFP